MECVVAAAAEAEKRRRRINGASERLTLGDPPPPGSGLSRNPCEHALCCLVAYCRRWKEKKGNLWREYDDHGCQPLSVDYVRGKTAIEKLWRGRLRRQGYGNCKSIQSETTGRKKKRSRLLRTKNHSRRLFP